MARRVTFSDLDKARVSSKNYFVSNGALSAYTVVFADSDLISSASPKSLDSYQKVIGILITDSNGTDRAVVQLNGRVVTGAGNFSAGDALFFDASGALTSTAPTEAASDLFIQQVGYALSNTEVFIQLHTPLKFS